MTQDFLDLDEKITLKGPWNTLQYGEPLTAVRILTLLEEEEEGTADEVFRILEEKHILPDLAGLPADPGTGKLAVRLRREADLVKKGNFPAGLEADDPLRVYLEELSYENEISAGREELIRQAAAGDDASRQQLFALSMGQVVEIAKSYIEHGVLLQDLIQEGHLGLWQAILDFAGGDFAACTEWSIRFAMEKEVLQQARAWGIGGKLKTLLEDFREADHRLMKQLGRNPTGAEIARELKLSESEVETVEKMLQDAQRLAKAAAPAEKDPDEDKPVEDTAFFRSRERVVEMLSVLDEEEAKLLSLRFGLEGGVPLNARETGERLGLTPEEVAEREGKALAKLRESE